MTDVDGRMLDYLLNHTEPAQPHVCGFCRNPWTRYGRKTRAPNTRLRDIVTDLIELCTAHRGSYGTCDTCGEYLPCACSDCECREVHVMPTTHAVNQERSGT